LPHLVVEGQRRHEGQIAPVVIETMKEGQWLRTVGLVFRDIR
jgi:hypothetical protein